MKTNLSSVDSYIRTLIAISFIFNVFILPINLAGVIVLLTLSAIFLGTAASRFCFIYRIINFSTSSDSTVQSRESAISKKL